MTSHPGCNSAAARRGQDAGRSCEGRGKTTGRDFDENLASSQQERYLFTTSPSSGLFPVLNRLTWNVDLVDIRLFSANVIPDLTEEQVLGVEQLDGQRRSAPDLKDVFPVHSVPGELADSRVSMTGAGQVETASLSGWKTRAAQSRGVPGGI